MTEPTDFELLELATPYALDAVTDDGDDIYLHVPPRAIRPMAN